MGLVCGRSSSKQDPEASHEAFPAEASPKDAHFSAKCPVDPSLALALSHAADLLQDPPVAITSPGGSLQPSASEQSTGTVAVEPESKAPIAYEAESGTLAEGPESKLAVGDGDKEKGVSERTNGSDVERAVSVAEAEGHELRPQTSRPEEKRKEAAVEKAMGWSGGVSGRALTGQRRSFYSQSQRTGALPKRVDAPGGASAVHNNRPVNKKKEEASGAIAPQGDPPARTTNSENRRKECTGVDARGASPKCQSPARFGSGVKGDLHTKQNARGSTVLKRPVSQASPGAKGTAPTVGGRKRCVGPKPWDASVGDASIPDAPCGEQQKPSCTEKEGSLARAAVSGGKVKPNGRQTAPAVGGKGDEQQKQNGRVGLQRGSGVAEKRAVSAEKALPKSNGNPVVGRTWTAERVGVGFGRAAVSPAGRSLSKALATSGDNVTDKIPERRAIPTAGEKVTNKTPVKRAVPGTEVASRTKALWDGQKRAGTAGSLAASVGSGRRALTPPEGRRRATAGPKSAGVKNESGLPKGQLRKSPSAPSIIRTSEKAAGASNVRNGGVVAAARRVRAENGPLRSSHVERSYSPVLEPEIITAPVSRVLRSLARSFSERASEAGATFVYPDEWEGDTWPAKDVGACGACRLSLLERSPYCRATSHGESDTYPDEVSMHSILVCGHFYHSECLERVFGYATTDGTCPRCLVPGL